MRYNYRINSYTFHPCEPDEKFPQAMGNFYYLVDPELYYLFTVWSETMIGFDNDLSGLVADMMEERPPLLKCGGHETAWRRLRGFMLAVFAHRDKGPRPDFSLPEPKERRKKK